MLSINNLLLNIFVNLFGILAFLSVDIKPRYQRTCIAVLACLTILLCMTFPFYTVGHAFFDLRVIPLILAILYGGPRVGLLCAAFLFGYRAFLGTGFGLTLSVLGMLPVILASLLSIKRFRRAQRLPRATIAAGLSLITFISLLVSSCLMRASNKDLLLFLISDCLLQLLTMWMTVYMVETLRENIRMRHEVQRMEKLHVLGELAASIAHEIRNPMTVTKGFVQLLNEHVPDHKKHYIHISIAELARAESIINDYLSYAKPQIELPEALAVEEEIEQIANVMSSYATLAGVEIVQHISEPLTILAD
ncbi:MAG: histidine kinase dimerization/phospho-acceptor domain-containing protein, partial [Tumebacillaceae bacterium]